VPLGAGSVGIGDTVGLAFARPDSAMARFVLGRNYKTIRPLGRFAERVMDIAAKLEDRTALAKLRSIPLSLLSLPFDPIWRLLYRRYGSRIRARLRADERCTGCRRCERLCPVGAVTVSGRAVAFGDACFLCGRCLHQCPRAAIQIGRRTADRFRWRGPGGDFAPEPLRP
jgi:ferredoxin